MASAPPTTTTTSESNNIKKKAETAKIKTKEFVDEFREYVPDWFSCIMVWLGAIASAVGLLSLYRFFCPSAGTGLPSLPFKQKTLEFGAKFLQKRAPVDNIHTHFCGIHSYSGEPTRQVIGHHYCSCLSPDVQQCVIYDSEKPNARLIGVEYIISAKLFKQLPEKEKKLWHSHTYEIKGGILVAPRMPAVCERQLMQGIVNTYGKTFHFWQVDRGDSLPLGPPTLMMSVQSDQEVDKGLVRKISNTYGTNWKTLRKARSNIPTPPHIRGADSWKDGTVVQITTDYVKI